MIVFKILRNIAVGIFMIIGGYNGLQTENAKADALERRFAIMQEEVISYEVKRVPMQFGSRVRGFFKTADGDTYLCDDTFDLDRNDKSGSFKQGPASFWVLHGSRDNMIYQMKTDKGMVLTYMDTMNSEAPKPKGAYLLMGFGAFFAFMGFLAAFYFNKEKEERKI